MSETEIKIIEPKTKIWASRERTVQIEDFEPEKVIAGITDATDESWTLEQKKQRLKALGDMVEQDLNLRVDKLLKAISEAPAMSPKMPFKAPEKPEEGGEEIPTKKCSKCGQVLKGKPDKFKEGEFYFWCVKCEKYERD